MLNRGKFGSAMTPTVTIEKDFRPRKFVKLSDIVYDTLVRS